MLILARRPGERVVIGDEVMITVMEVSGHTVRLGIAAPDGVPRLHHLAVGKRRLFPH